MSVPFHAAASTAKMSSGISSVKLTTLEQLARI